MTTDSQVPFLWIPDSRKVGRWKARAGTTAWLYNIIELFPTAFLWYNVNPCMFFSSFMDDVRHSIILTPRDYQISMLTLLFNWLHGKLVFTESQNNWKDQPQIKSRYVNQSESVRRQVLRAHMWLVHSGLAVGSSREGLAPSRWDMLQRGSACVAFLFILKGSTFHLTGGHPVPQMLWINRSWLYCWPLLNENTTKHFKY